MKLDYIRLLRMRNLTHLQFHRDNVRLIEKEGAEKLGIATMFPIYVAFVGELAKAVKKVGKSVYSGKIKDSDKKRDATYTALKYIVAAALVSDNPNTENAAKRLSIIFDSNKKVNKLSLVEQSAALDRIIKNLKSDKYEKDVDLLNMQELIEQLERHNNELRELMRSRTDEAVLNKTEKTIPIRRKLDEVYRTMNKRIEAGADINGDADFKRYIGLHNLAISDYKKMMAKTKPRVYVKSGKSPAS